MKTNRSIIRWVDAQRSIPKKEGRVIVCDEFGNMEIMNVESGKNLAWSWELFKQTKLVAWAMLPKYPKQTTKL